MRRILLILTAGVLGGGYPVVAQAPAPVPVPVFRDDVVVTASADSEVRADVPVAVTVIDGKEIEARQSHDLADLLNTVPGLSVVQAGSPGQQTSLFTRGTNSNQTLLLWNGIPLNDPFFADARAQGRGAILWISDFVSAGDASKAALAREALRVAHLSPPAHGFTTSRFGIRWLNPFRLAFEGAYLSERIVFERHDPAPAMARIERILRQNGIVSIMASMHEGGTLAHVPFLNGGLRLSLGAVRLGLLSRPPVLPL
ncbi:MAG TPA: TonB-dependent receptor plug domain-containing protein, partial [Thermoanaerobaculia bacterium]|nr:TonB-dependent receptor plug domain-containing protein [Thermoanaerobaculia bacterium]